MPLNLKDLAQRSEYENFHTSCEVYIKQALDELYQRVADTPELLELFRQCQVDHLGIRVDWGLAGEGDYSRYKEIRDILEKHATPVFEPIYNGRPICIMNLTTPLLGTINHLEVPAPRIDKENEVEGIDHFELVLPEGFSLMKFVTKYYKYLTNNGLVSQERLKEAIHDIARDKFNADLVLEFNGFKIKIHEMHIAEVIQFEKENHIEAIEFKRQEFEKAYPGVLIAS